MYQSLEPKT